MNKLDYFSKETGLELIADSSVWNYHGIDNLFNVANRKGSNLYKSIMALKTAGYRGGVTIVAGCIGRSQHNETSLGIFRGITSINEYGGYYSKSCDEVFITDDFGGNKA